MSKVKILVAEDDKLNRIIICKLLEKYGAECDTAVDGREALDKCFSEKYNIVMLDYNMPGYSGSECASMIREKFKDTTDCPMIVGASADDDHEYDEVFDDFLLKPFKVNKIQQLIAKVLKED